MDIAANIVRAEFDKPELWDSLQGTTRYKLLWHTTFNNILNKLEAARSLPDQHE